MGLDNNKGPIKPDESLQYPTIPTNNIIYMLFNGIVITPESMGPLSHFLENKKFSRHDEHNYENIRENLKITYKETEFITIDTNIIINIIDKLYDYFTEYKKSLLKDIDELKESKDSFELDYRLASIQAYRTAEEYLIEMLQMKNILDKGIENNEFCIDEYRLRLENLILDYFGDFERESKNLDNLEKEYNGNSIEIDKLQHDNEMNSNTINDIITSKKLDNYLVKQKRDVARCCVGRIKDEIYRLIKGFDIILSKDLSSKLGKYPEFSELLNENNKKVSEAIEIA